MKDTAVRTVGRNVGAPERARRAGAVGLPPLRSLLAGLVLAPLAALALNGCSSSAAAPSAAAAGGTASAAPGSELTPAQARQIFATFATADDVARAAGDEPLNLRLVNEAQLPLTVSAYERAGYTGTSLTRYRYGKPRLYVPNLKSFPLWFAAVVPRTPANGSRTRTAIMIFSREEPSGTWQLSLSTLLAPGMTLPRITLDRHGLAIALATFQRGLLASPNSVGALQSAVADDGPAAAGARIVAAGPYTTGLHHKIATAKHRFTRLGLRYDSVFIGTAFPLYALRTADGGGLVLYSLNRSTVVKPGAAKPRQIRVPPAFAPILAATRHPVVDSELDLGETYQYAAHVPPSRAGGAIRVIAAAGGPTSADGK